MPSSHVMAYYFQQLLKLDKTELTKSLVDHLELKALFIDFHIEHTLKGHS